MIKLIMLTGFLGAGKTTLLRRIIDEYKEKKIGVLVNEFGAVSVDTEIIERDGLKMTELTNGSIFCACIKDKFVESLILMSGMEIDYLFIEASGLADPSSMPDILKGIDARLSRKYEYGHSICIADGTSFTDLFELLESLKKQVAYSDIIIINKTDIAEELKLNRVYEIIEEVNPLAVIYDTSYCDIDIKAVIESPSGLIGKSEESSNTFGTRPQTLVLRERREVDCESLMHFIQKIAESTYRIKGFLNSERGALKIDCVGKQINVSSWDKEVKEAKLVVISSVGIGIVSVVTSALNEYMKGSLTL